MSESKCIAVCYPKEGKIDFVVGKPEGGFKDFQETILRMKEKGFTSRVGAVKDASGAPSEGIIIKVRK